MIVLDDRIVVMSLASVLHSLSWKQCVRQTEWMTLSTNKKHRCQNNGQSQSRRQTKDIFFIFQNRSSWSWYFLCRGTALSRHTPLNSAPSAKINGSNPSVNTLLDDSRPIADDDPSAQPLDRTNETRRPRVYFADVNRVQFFEDTNDEFEPTNVNTKLRRSRQRSAKRSTALLATNPISPPSIQHSQSLYVPYPSSSSSSSRPQQPMQELNIRKHHLVSSPRIHSSRITHLPDILNQSFSSGENPIKEKYVLQREKPILRFPEPAAEQSLNSSAEISRESTRAGGVRPTMMTHSNDSSFRFDSEEFGGISALLNNSFISSIPTSRTRPSLNNLSLRQQFLSTTKAKPPVLSNPGPVRRSTSMKQPVARMHSADEETLANQEPTPTLENRPQTGLRPNRRSNRNYVLHFNSKVPFNGNPILESNELTQTQQQQQQPTLKSSVYDSSQDRAQNPLKILRPSYLSSLNSTSVYETGKKHTEGSVRSSRTNSTRRSYDYQVTSNTIIV